MKTTVKAQEEAIENTAENPTDPGNAVANTETKDLATQDEAVSGIQGEFGGEDVNIPILSLVQKTGDMSEVWPQGTWVFDKNHALTTGYDKQEKPIDGAVFRLPVTVIGLKKYWRQNKAFKEPGFAKTWDLEEEALQTPATDPLNNPLKNEDGSPKFFKRGNTGSDTFAEAANVIFLFPISDEYAEFFDGEGQGYARAMYRATNTAWQIAKTLYSGALGAARRNAKKGEVPIVKTHVVSWELGALKFTKDQDIYFKPLVSNLGRHKDPFIEWLETEVIPPL